MSLSKHQLAGKPSKKTLSLDEKVKFLYTLLKAIRTLDAENLQKYLKSEKLLLQTFLKKRSLFVACMNYYVKSLRNIIGLASTKKSMTFYTCGIRDLALRVFIQMTQCWKKRQWRSKKVFSLDQFRDSDGWLDTWKSAYATKERRIVGQAGGVAEETITSWMERILQLTENHGWHLMLCKLYWLVST